MALTDQFGPGGGDNKSEGETTMPILVPPPILTFDTEYVTNSLTGEEA